MLRLVTFLVVGGLACVTAGATPVEIFCEVTAPGGKPVEGAEVLVMLNPNYNQEAGEAEMLGSGKTDAEGKLTVKVPGGEARYATVIARKEGVGVIGAVAVLSEEGGADANLARHLSMGLLPMAECRLRLLKPDGTPAAGIRVWVTDCAMPLGKQGFTLASMYGVSRLPEVGWEAQTDAEGRCVIPGLPRGASVYLRHDGEDLAQLLGRHDPYSANAIRALGQEQEQEQEQERQLVKAGSLRGKIVTAEGTPLAGCHLFLLEDLRPYITAYGEQIIADAEGRFEFKQVPPSAYKILYRSPQSEEQRWIGDSVGGMKVEEGQPTTAPDLVMTVPGIVTAKVLDAETGKEIEEPIIIVLKAGTHQVQYRSHRMGPSTHLAPARGESVPVEVSTGERKEIAFRLRPVKGDNTVTGVVLDEKGKPVRGAGVMMTGGHSNDLATPHTTDEKGAFCFVVKSPKDSLTLLAWTEGAISEPMPVKAGGSAELRLQTNGLASLRGVIRDEQGKPVPDAHFQVVYDIHLDMMIGGPLPDHTRVGLDGAFHLQRLPKAVKEVTLFAYADGYGGDALRDLVLKPGECFEWNPVLKQARETVTGRVVDVAGAPVAGVQIRISGDGQPVNRMPVLTDAQGRFKVENLSVGAVRVRAQQRTQTQSRDVYLSTKLPASDLRLVLPDATGKISGIVRDHEGRPVLGAEVNCFSNDRKATTDKQGRFAFEGIELGWLTVRVKAVGKDGDPLEEDFRLKAGMQKVSLDLPAETSPEYSSAPPLDLTGQSAPEIHVATWIHSEPLAAKAGGKVRILDFWGMECSPCLAWFPKVQKFWEQHGGEGIEIIALGSAHHPKEEVQEYLQKHSELTFPMAIQTKEARDAVAYQVRGVPTYVVIGKDGKILSSGHDWEVASTLALRANAAP